MKSEKIHTDNRCSSATGSPRRKKAFFQVQLITVVFVASSGLMVSTAEIYNAIKSRDAAQLRELLKENTAEIIRMTSTRGSTPIHWAAIENSEEAAKLLLGEDVNVNAMAHNGYTPLHWAAIGNSAEVAAILIDKGARVDAKSEEGFTPLHLAMQKNSLDAARILLENGASIYSKTKEGSTPLSFVRSTDARTLLEEHVAGAQNDDKRHQEADNRNPPAEKPADDIPQKIKYESGAVYTGTLRKGKKHGKGVLVYSDEEKYSGTWMDGKKHGFGVYSFPNGEKYTGEWKNGQRHGAGTYSWPNGDTLKGLWQNGEFKNGTGTYHFADGDVYKGQWQNNRMWGYGVYITAEGKEFTGYWNANKLVKTTEKLTPEPIPE